MHNWTQQELAYGIVLYYLIEYLVLSIAVLNIAWRVTVVHFTELAHCFKRDLMAQRLARWAEDREVPGSSPTQD